MRRLFCFINNNAVYLIQNNHFFEKIGLCSKKVLTSDQRGSGVISIAKTLRSYNYVYRQVTRDTTGAYLIFFVFQTKQKKDASNDLYLCMQLCVSTLKSTRNSQQKKTISIEHFCSKKKSSSYEYKYSYELLDYPPLTCRCTQNSQK